MGEEAQGTPTPPTNEISVTGAEPTMAGDEITIGGVSHTTLMPVVERPRRRRRLAIIAAGLAMTLVAGIAIAAAAIWNGWGGKQPEQALPASALFFARVDLAPGLGQSLALKRLADKFPKSADSSNAERGVVDELTEDLLHDAGLESLDYEADLKGWFGGRAGFAYWLRNPTDKAGCALYALASKNEAKATTALSKVRDREGPGAFGFGFKDGYAVTAACDDQKGSQAAAEAAVAAATTSSLAESATYRGALDSLPSDQLAVIWADLAGLGKAFADQFVDVPNGATVTGLDTIVDSLKGDLIVGLTPTGAGIELRYRQRGGGSPARAADALKELAALPGGAVLGVSTDLRQAGGTLASNLMGLGFFGFGFGFVASIGADESCVGIDPDAPQEELERCLGDVPPADPDDPCLNLDEKSTPEELQKCFGDVPAFDPNDPCLNLDEKSTPEELQKCFGGTPGFDPNDPCLTLTSDSPPEVVDKCMGQDMSQWSKGYEAMSRSAFTGAFSSLADTVAARLVVTAATEADAAAIEAIFGVQTDPDLTVTRSGTGLTATTKGFEAGSGTLADSARYRQALEGAPSSSLVAFFVDMEKLNPTFNEKDRARLKPVKAIGGGFGYEGSDSVGLIRVIIE